MKIVTVNLPAAYVKMMEDLVGNDKLYPSRSELVRVAVRDFILLHLEKTKKLVATNENEEEKHVQTEMVQLNPSTPEVEVIKIPTNEPGKFKCYKVIAK